MLADGWAAGGCGAAPMSGGGGMTSPCGDGPGAGTNLNSFLGVQIGTLHKVS